jgi:hypothetical protein
VAARARLTQSGSSPRPARTGGKSSCKAGSVTGGPWSWACAEALRRRCLQGTYCSRSTHDGLQVMHLTLLGYFVAIVIGGVSQIASEPPWLSSALFFLALLIALLATLSFARDRGWLGATPLRHWGHRSPQVRAERMSPEDGSSSQAAPRAQAPRPAGPAGPVPVLQKRPKDATSDPMIATGVPGPKPSDE